MVQIVTSVKNTFEHADVDSPECDQIGSSARRRTASTPARVLGDAEMDESYDVRAFGAHGLEEFRLPPHDADDYSSMHSHPGPSPLDMAVEAMLGRSVPETEIDDHFLGLAVSQPHDEVTPDFVEITPDFVSARMDFDDTFSAEFQDHGASSLAQHGWTQRAQLPHDSYRESLAQDAFGSSTVPMTPHEPAQRQFYNSSPNPPREEQRNFYRQSYSENAPTSVVSSANYDETQGEETRTTVMLMNVPLGYTNSKLMRTMDSEGFGNLYDFIYVPMGAARTSKGYAFVNLVNPSVAQGFISAFNGFSRWLTASKNTCQAVWAKQHQGLHANIDRYRNSTVLGKSVPEEYKPRLFNNGEDVPFPPPNRKHFTPSGRGGHSRRTNVQHSVSL